MFGREMTLPLDLVLGKPEPKYYTQSEYAHKLENQLEVVHEMARKNIKFASET